MGGRGSFGERGNTENHENRATYRKVLTGTGNSKGLTAIIRHYAPLNQWSGQYSVSFEAFGEMDNDYRGTNGTGMKVYDTEEKAIQAAKRYIKRWK